MSLPPIIPGTARKLRARIFQQTKNTVLLVLCALLILCIVFAWTTRDAMSHLPFISVRGSVPVTTKKAIVDLSPWQTAQALAPLAVTAEETEYAREAERLADHEVDQAFAAALRQATIQAQHRTLSGDALALSQRIDQLQQMVDQDQVQVRRLSGAGSAGADSNESPGGETDLDIAKAQLQLDSDELADAQQDLARASGDKRAQIQGELSAHEAAMRKYDAESHGDGQIAVLSAALYGTLAGRLRAWNDQRSRYQLIQQARDQALTDVQTLTAQHNALEAQANGNAPVQTTAQDRNTKLADIRDRTSLRQLLSIYDDRIQTEQQLGSVYDKWATQVLLQHRILLHLILQSVTIIVVILICMILGDGLVRRLMSHPVLDRRQAQTLRMILELTLQVIGALLILIIVFGVPHETPTILGLTTAALTIALQDFFLAFFGWFILVGKRGIRIGDWVEINGVGGEVTEVGLMRTTLLETGNFAGGGYPTGRRITFMNGFAIRGQFFNFSTTGQWMWDELTVSLPASIDTQVTVERVLEAVNEETHESAHIAEQEWKQRTHGDGLSKFRTDPAVNLRPSGSGVDIEIRYVTRAWERVEMRNRLYRHILELLHQPAIEPQAEAAH
jgi:small-conductance mechanosensitive channel